MRLVIVESPTKAKTISKFLGSGFDVVSSLGHVRDLPKSGLGVDLEKNFEPSYVIPTKARKTVTDLKKRVAKADSVVLATDEDREGEAIAWHLKTALSLKEENAQRIVFHEITKTAIENALTHPRPIDTNLVDAQQARRVLDRLVGYKLSPFLWKKVARGLSAGRVQSVALRLVVEREREIEAFKADEYWSIEALLKTGETTDSFTAFVATKNDKAIPKLGIASAHEATAIGTVLEKASYTVADVIQKDTRKRPLAPFTTSTLQQAAGARFGYPAKRTMMLAQNLYERGFITYHRTDSLNLATSAIEAARSYITEEFGAPYLPASPRLYKSRAKGAQEAHEAIRPAFPEGTTLSARDPEKLKLEGPQKKLYTLIWQRFLASQMEDALQAATTITITTDTPYGLRANGAVVRFDGFARVYPVAFDENELPQVTKGQTLDLEKLIPNQHFTQPPARYSEAALVKELEKNGVGRPSTYATIISTIQDRNYVARNEQKRLAPTEIGLMVNDLLVEHFPKVVDIGFTAKMEEQFDTIAEGNLDWHAAIAEFWGPFSENLEEKMEEVKSAKVAQETDRACPECGKPLLKRMGRFGWFFACSGFPECRFTEAIRDEADGPTLPCPKCVVGEISPKRTRRGKIFYGCNKYPACDFALWDKPVAEAVEGTPDKHRVRMCPECSSPLVEKKAGIACSSKECKFKEKTAE
jgi:DNA topoisomerase-1